MISSPQSDLADALSQIVGDSPANQGQTITVPPNMATWVPAGTPPTQGYAKFPIRPRGTPPQDSPLGPPPAGKKPRVVREESIPESRPEVGAAGGNAAGAPDPTVPPSTRTRSMPKFGQGQGVPRAPSVVSSVTSRISIAENCADAGPNCPPGPESRCLGVSGIDGRCQKPVCTGCSPTVSILPRHVPLQGLHAS